MLNHKSKLEGSVSLTPCAAGEQVKLQLLQTLSMLIQNIHRQTLDPQDIVASADGPLCSQTPTAWETGVHEAM